MHLSPEVRTLANTLIDGAQKTVMNADELFDEARLLAGAGHVARALLLHQISLEECGKLEMLYVATAEVLRGQAVDMKRLARAFSKHAAKNRTNAYFLAKSEAELAAEEQNDIGAAHQAFNEMQDEFHEKSNDLKNASLYVDYDGSFRAPREVISAEHLEELFNRNGAFMSMAFHKLTIMLRWKADLDAAAVEVANLWAMLSMDELDRDKPETLAALKKRLAEVAEKGLSFRRPSGGG
jgi:AbiV family abortive infection protein